MKTQAANARRTGARRPTPQARAATAEPAPRPSFAAAAALVCVTALAVRLVHLWFLQRSPFAGVLLGDAQSYDTWARQIAAGDWIGHDVFYQAPLYAYFLGIIYRLNGGLLAVRVVQAVVGAAACGLLALAAYRLLGRRAGLIAGVALALFAPAVFAGGLIQKSILDLFFLCALLAIVAPIVASDAGRPRRWFAVGATIGALSLTRENALAFVPVVAAWILLAEPAAVSARARFAALVIAGAAVILVPVGLRNLAVGGEFHLTTAQSGPNFYIGNHPNADGTYAALRYGHGSPEYERADATAIASQAAGHPLSPGEVSAYWTDRALTYIRDQPLDWLRLEARKFRLLWNVSEIIDTESQESHADYSPLLAALGWFATFGVLVPLATAGLWMTWSDRRRLSLLYALIAAYAASVLAFYVVARYRLPLAPLLIPFAAVALDRGWTFLRTQPARAKIIGGVVIAAVALFCNVPAGSPDLMRAVTFENLGTALQLDGHLDEAADVFRRAVALRPDYAPAHNGLGSVLRQQGKADAAIAELQDAVRLQPDFTDASYNLANALVDRGRLPEAIARYEALLQPRNAGDPASLVDVRSNLGIALASAGRLDEALVQFREAAALAPDSATPHYNLGHALLAHGDAAGAATELSRAVQIDPGNAAAHDELGNALMAQQQPARAIGEFRESLRLAPDVAETHNDLGIALGSSGQLAAAIEEFRRAVALDPAFEQAQANLRMSLAAQQGKR